MKIKNITMLGGGFIGDFDIQALHGHRKPGRVDVVFPRSLSSAQKVAKRHGVKNWTDGTVKLILKKKSTGKIIQRIS